MVGRSVNSKPNIFTVDLTLGIIKYEYLWHKVLSTLNTEKFHFQNKVLTQDLLR